MIRTDFIEFTRIDHDASVKLDLLQNGSQTSIGKTHVKPGQTPISCLDTAESCLLL